MKTVKIAFIALLITFPVIFAKAQEPSQQIVSAPLKLSLSIKEKELCIGKEFEIRARMENISDTIQIIDKRDLWR